MNKDGIFPYCYKIKDSCLPCNDNNHDCLKELYSDALLYGVPVQNPIKTKSINDLFECLKKYGDIYKKLNIELYVDKYGKIIFPNIERIIFR